jgi:hypothetical protein
MQGIFNIIARKPMSRCSLILEDTILTAILSILKDISCKIISVPLTASSQKGFTATITHVV